MPKPGPRKRSTTAEAALPTIVLFVEGETEGDYFTHWAARLRGKVTLNVDPDRGKDPKRVAELAIAEAKLHRGRRGRPPTEVWCVYDVDDHHHLIDATHKAWANSVRVAISDPCFEIWLYFHRVDQTGQIERHKLQRETEIAIGCDKRLSRAVFDDLLPDQPTATLRALTAYARNVLNDSLKPDDSNPSTNVWQLTTRLEAFDAQ